jgi:hypothetical protein
MCGLFLWERAVAKVGRPSSYTDAVATTICREIALGRSLQQIQRDPGMPSMTSVLRWLDARPEFRTQYARAREQQADYYAAEIVEIADTEEDPNKARVRIDARKWVACKLKPKKYGDSKSIELSGVDGGAIRVDSNVTLTPAEAYERLLRGTE